MDLRTWPEVLQARRELANLAGTDDHPDAEQIDAARASMFGQHDYTADQPAAAVATTDAPAAAAVATDEEPAGGAV